MNYYKRITINNPNQPKGQGRKNYLQTIKNKIKNFSGKERNIPLSF